MARQRSCTAYGWKAAKPLELGGHLAYIMRAFGQGSLGFILPSSTTTRSSLYKTRSLCRWTSIAEAPHSLPQRVSPVCFTRPDQHPSAAAESIWFHSVEAMTGKMDEITNSWHPSYSSWPTGLFFPRPHFGRRHGRKRIRQPVSPGWVSGHATLPANGYWLEGKSRPPFQTCRMTSPLAVRAYSWPQRWFAELSRLLTAALWPILLRWDLLSQANGMTWHPQPGLWALHLCLSMGAFRPSRECAKYYLSR